jgi:hypothetical protein
MYTHTRVFHPLGKNAIPTNNTCLPSPFLYPFLLTLLPSIIPLYFMLPFLALGVAFNGVAFENIWCTGYGLPCTSCVLSFLHI